MEGLVNNAGIPFRSRVHEIELADWERVLATNLTGPLLGIQTVLPLTIFPGFIETPMTASAPPEFRTANILEIPLARTGTPEEVAPLVVYLISDESACPRDGGRREAHR